MASGLHAETRSLSLVFGHTRESTTVVYKRNGRFIPDGLKKLNHFLRDWRAEKSTKMDPKLFDILWTVHKLAGSRVPIQIVSAYRSPKTNTKLRKRSRGVAKNSQHTHGKAIDFYMPDVPLARIRKIGLKLAAGGVGFYPKSGSPFIHLDTGSVRHWPRMTRKQLVKVFPKGKTLHIPTDGKPLAGYQLAMAEYKKRRSEGIAMASLGQTQSKPTNPFAFLFGSGNDEAEARARRARPSGATSAPVALAASEAPEPELTKLANLPVPLPRPSPQMMASAYLPEAPETPEAPAATAISFAPSDPEPRPLPPSQKKALAELIAREKEQWSARALALAAMSNAAEKPPSIAESAPPILASLGPIKRRPAKTEAPRPAPEMAMFDRSDFGPLFLANRISVDDSLKSSKGDALYAVPKTASHIRFQRAPGRDERLATGNTGT